MRKILPLLASLFLISTAYAQSPKEQLQLVNAAKLESADFFSEIPFQDKFGYFIIPVTVGNEKYDYIFDTGGYNTLTAEIMDKNKLPKLMEVEVGSSNKIKSKIILTKIPSLTIGGIDFKDIGAFNFDFKESPQIKCFTNGGLIGKSIIKNAVWQINAKEQKIILTDNLSKLKNLDQAIRVKVKLDKTYNPFIEAKINGKTTTFLLDFGYGGFISLTEKSGGNLNSKTTIEIVGEGAVSANGTLNESTFIKKLDSFNIAGFNIADQAAYYSKSNNYNLIGTEITKHFIVTLNLKENELFLTPVENPEKKLEKTFGFDLNRNDTTIYVSKIYKGSSAEKSGLYINDIVLSINENKITEIPYCDFYDHTREFLRAEKPLRLTVKRGEQLLDIVIMKSPLFKIE